MVESVQNVDNEQLLKTLYAVNLKVSAIIHSGEVQKLKGELEEAVSALNIISFN